VSNAVVREEGRTKRIAEVGNEYRL